MLSLFGIRCTEKEKQRHPRDAFVVYPSYLKLQRCWLHSFTGTPARPNHIAYLCSWGFTHLPPTCNFKLFGYI
ncbi:hypothetical protein CRN58_11415 [Vibrio vulnificus]|uniref:Uncharacterized protein n=1 Tax=Vibrio vulnificus TaxID=672 RepID=A0A2S3R4F6_VIBVL|nr:hypothetical protein BWZ32_02245 [Vibrio vulnificus]PNM95672.1 hypothetical protein AL547_015050 [Vibrio vulnificus]POB48559.1 hypothetical protein CRN52_08325 [Vibrio vulnificus]POB58757.1 hypothetical protein CRN26_02915 [Vibrio vulnificus]POF58940.1 hypothetical protein CRN58_11415 [Vibrio vulnificus]